MMKETLLRLRNSIRKRVTKTFRGVSSPPAATYPMKAKKNMSGVAMLALNVIGMARAIPPLSTNDDSSL